MKNEITFKLLSNSYGKVRVDVKFPNFSVPTSIEKLYNLWHISIQKIKEETGKKEAEKAEAWLCASRKLQLTEYEMRKLRKKKELCVPASDIESMKLEWKRIHTRNKNMTQKFNTPKLSNI